MKNQSSVRPSRLPEGKETRSQGQPYETVLMINQYLIDEHRTKVEMLNYKSGLKNFSSASLPPCGGEG